MIACLASGGLTAAQEASRDLTWTTIPAMPPDVEAMAPWIRPQAGQPAVLDEARLDEILRSAPLEDTPAAAAPIVVWFPTPGGTFERFLVVETPILTPDFAAARPDLRTYRGWGIDESWRRRPG